MYKFLVFFFVFISACDDRYKPTNYYDTNGTYIISAGKQGFTFNSYSFFIKMNTETIKNNNELTFIISGLSRNSEPNVKLFFDQAKLIVGGKILNSINGEITAVKGSVNPKNGECLFNEYTLRFPYEPKLHWGEKINSNEIKQDILELSNFYVSIPAEVPEFDSRPDFESEKDPIQPKVHNIMFKYSKIEEPGERLISFGSW
jgi:hypothetical protein